MIIINAQLTRTSRSRDRAISDLRSARENAIIMPAVVDDDKTKAAAEKQLQTMLGATSSLVGKDYHSFKKQLDRFALAYDWPTHILDPEEQLDTDVYR